MVTTGLSKVVTTYNEYYVNIDTVLFFSTMGDMIKKRGHYNSIIGGSLQSKDIKLYKRLWNRRNRAGQDTSNLNYLTIEEAEKEGLSYKRVYHRKGHGNSNSGRKEKEIFLNTKVLAEIKKKYNISNIIKKV